ncbi:hypothetical protein E5676_scaffold120G00800 [Cucumis melo var. makuwa]|uniref:Uncharacterized protein n=1 Tax=Cucumis melo var. makuwa TaxID=1194695 RepID=A0A5D3DZD9_CUCMM|nr:hypothetical protein E5676_scaffold120G00800 [Cucumis melo var. makuwa]
MTNAASSTKEVRNNLYAQGRVRDALRMRKFYLRRKDLALSSLCTLTLLLQLLIYDLLMSSLSAKIVNFMVISDLFQLYAFVVTSDTSWLLDPACSNHMTSGISLLFSPVPV